MNNYVLLAGRAAGILGIVVCVTPARRVGRHIRLRGIRPISKG